MAQLEEITAKIQDGPEATVKFSVPETVQEALDIFGEEVVYSRFRASLIIDLQSFMRTQMKKEEWSEEAVQESVSAWTPGTKARGKSKVEKLREMISSLSDEDRASVLAELGIDED